MHSLSAATFEPDERAVRGSNHSGMRQFNERTVLQAIRLHGAIAKADLARLTQLSSQTVSIIVSRLLDDGLLLKQERVRGRIGQPSVPLALNPDGAISLGVQVGRRSLEVLACDFVGRVRHRHEFHYDLPDPARVLPCIAEGLTRLQQQLGDLWARVVGLGLSSPLSMEKWSGVLGSRAHGALAGWEHLDLRREVEAMTHLPVSFAKDTTAACVAELLQGHGTAVRSFLYIFVGTFVGGGLVLSGHIVTGQRGNAGAIGSLPLGLAQGDARRAPAQLLSVASLFNLESLYLARGLDAGAATDARALQPPWLEATEAWLRDAAPAVALAVNSAACLLDLEGVIIDGSFDGTLLQRLITRADAALDAYSWEGVTRPALLAGTIGSDARAIGGALLPLYAHFAPDRDLFLKLEA